MATIRLLASIYQLSNTTYLKISNPENMYTNTDSATYATITHNRAATTAYYVYVRGFNFSDIPSNATVTSAIVKVRARAVSCSAATPILYNGTTSLSKNLSGTVTSTTYTRTVDITSSFDTYKKYGNNFGIRFQLNRSNKNTGSSLYIYGAEIEVTYTVPATETLWFRSQAAALTKIDSVYKKTSSGWELQSNLLDIFDENTNYYIILV